MKILSHSSAKKEVKMLKGFKFRNFFNFFFFFFFLSFSNDTMAVKGLTEFECILCLGITLGG